MTTPCVIYARFSTDKQRETSIEDQARVCRARAETLGLEIIGLHADNGVSGSTPVAARPGGAQLLADALAGRFRVLLLECLDRLSRTLVEQETIVRRLEHRDIRIIGVADGYDSASGTSRKLTRGMRGLVNEIYIDDLRAKTHRGLCGQIERGFHAGGLAYGYRSVAHGGGHRLEVDAAQAEQVRWIFARYAGGWSCQKIGATLNAQGVRGPRGGTWSVSALYGSPAKGAGVLNNELYVGRYVWNRSQWVKDPDSGKRQRLQRPRTEWRVGMHPELRIVDDELWAQVRARMESPRRAGGRRGRGAAPRTLFGGILRCGSCGAAVIAVSAHLYGCSARKDRGPAVCQGVSAPRRNVETRLLGFLRDELLTPAAIAELEQQIAERPALRRQEAATAESRAASRRTELTREIGRLTDAIAAMGLSPALRGRLERAERELEALDQPTARPVPADDAIAIRERLRRMALDLGGTLERDMDRARDVLRDLLGGARLVREDDAVYAEVETRLDRVLVAAGGASLGRVAGTGFEPVTFGL
jgi:site-specific DNA recombinase